MYLGIDLGTSGLRALLVDDAGTPVSAAEHQLSVSNPRRGWSEQNPADWIEALETVVCKLRSKHSRFSELKGIGVAGHMHGAVLLDKAGKVLRPCILWNDTRSHEEAAALDADCRFRDLSGNIVFPGFTAPKLEWVRKNEPWLFARTTKVLLPAAFLNHFLTGTFASDMSDAAGTSWLDVGNRQWSETLLAASHMRRDQMPNAVEGTESIGVLRGELASKWDLSNDVVVAGGAGDNAAAACGMGCLNDGDGFISLGTSGVLLAARNKFRPSPETALHTFCHAAPDRWYQMGVMLSATDCLNWLSRISGEKPAELTAQLGTVLQEPGSVRFLPYLSGERTPHNDADIRGSFTGLSNATSRADLTRAVLEGVAFGLRDSYQALRTTKTDFKQLFAIGGGAGSHYWLKAIATALNIVLVRPSGGENGAALGAARLSICAATGASPEDIMQMPEAGETILPDENLVQVFDDAYQAFRTSYPAIRSIQ